MSEADAGVENSGMRVGDIRPIDLPRQSLRSSASLAQALRRRRTTRELSDRKLSPQILSNLLWAACGVNRAKGPFGGVGRTAASASNSQEIDIYVAMPDATYLYDPRRHRLTPAAAGDHRRMAIGRGQKASGDAAPVRLIYVADIDKLVHTSGFQEPGLHDVEVQKSYYFVDTGLIAGNVYLCAASAGLAAWFHNCDKAAVSAALGLRADQRVLFGQTVGYPIARARAAA